MSTKRTLEDLIAHAGSFRVIEWFWKSDGSMPGLDIFEDLDDESQDAVIASLEVWADLPHGQRVSQTRVNTENKKPLILR